MFPMDTTAKVFRAPHCRGEGGNFTPVKSRNFGATTGRRPPTTSQPHMARKSHEEKGEPMRHNRRRSSFGIARGWLFAVALSLVRFIWVDCAYGQSNSYFYDLDGNIVVRSPAAMTAPEIIR